MLMRKIKKRPILLLNLGLKVFGLILLSSAIEHFMADEALSQHYAVLGYSGVFKYFIGSLQLIAGFGLLFSRTQKLTCLILSFVMLVIILLSFVRQNAPFPTQALFIFCFSFGSFWVLKNVKI
jgi:uncharacterized membrane protein YphA (DoxX/SURF4 family)